MAVLERETEPSGERRPTSGKSRAETLRDRAAQLAGGRDRRPEDGEEPRAESREPRAEGQEARGEGQEARGEGQEARGEGQEARGKRQARRGERDGSDGSDGSDGMDPVAERHGGRIVQIHVGFTRKITRNYNSTEYHAGATVELADADLTDAEATARAYAAAYAMCREAVRAEFVRRVGES